MRDKVLSHLKENWLGWLCSIVVIVVIALGTFYIDFIIKEKTEEAFKEITRSEKFSNQIYNSIDSKVSFSPAQADFSLGKENDPKQKSMQFYVSENQEVHLHVKAVHHGEGELRKIQVFVGGNQIKNFDLSRSTEVVMSRQITSMIKKSIEESSYDFGKNIQKIEFRLDPTQINLTSDVSIEAIVVTKGIPRELPRSEQNNSGGENEED